MISVNLAAGGTVNDPIQDCKDYRRQALKWARYALQNKNEGLPWQGCANLAHEALSAFISLRGVV